MGAGGKLGVAERYFKISLGLKPLIGEFETQGILSVIGSGISLFLLQGRRVLLNELLGRSKA